MSLASKLNEWSSIILKVGLIVLVGVVLFWLGISVVANITEGNATGGVPDFPSINKAQYVVLLKTTGETLLTDKYDSPSEGVYILHGFYQLRDNKWRWYKNDLPLDEYYFGDIIITRREE